MTPIKEQNNVKSLFSELKKNKSNFEPIKVKTPMITII